MRNTKKIERNIVLERYSSSPLKTKQKIKNKITSDDNNLKTRRNIFMTKLSVKYD